jgi:CheY-like chemotaxis protein
VVSDIKEKSMDLRKERFCRNADQGIIFFQNLCFGIEVLEQAVRSIELPPDPVILLVDDCENTCRALGRDLRALGRCSLAVSDPTSAVMLLLDPDVRVEAAVVDLFLGADDGLDLLGFLEKRHPDIRRVLISGQVRSAQLDLALASGRADAVLSKPWSRKALAAVLRSADY